MKTWKPDRAATRCTLLILLLLQGACARPELSPLPPDAVILAFGDSLTAGVGADRSQSYPRVLSELSGLRVVNAGVSGETTAGGRARLSATLEQHTPDLLVLMEGGNDILRSKNPESTRANLAAMIEMASATGVDVVLMGVPDKMLFTDSAAYYKELATEYQLVFIDGSLASLLRNQRYKSDPIHLNAEGYRRLAESVHEALVEHGAL
jgi:lysophospholipase L1-like esterase